MDVFVSRQKKIMKIKILIIHSIFVEPGRALSNLIKYPVFTIQNYVPEHHDILIIFGAHNAGQALLKLNKSHNTHYIIMQSEQLNSPCFNNPFYKDLLNISMVFDWSYLNIHLLKQKYNINCKNIFSWCFLLPKQVDSTINTTKQFDIFFTGLKTKERIEMIQKLKELNPKLKWFVDLDYRLTDYIKLTKILVRCKYVINIPAYKGSALETHRIIKALSCNCQVLSPPSADIRLTEELTPYVHFGELAFLIENINSLEKKKTITDYKKDYQDISVEKFKENIESFKRDKEIQN